MSKNQKKKQNQGSAQRNPQPKQQQQKKRKPQGSADTQYAPVAMATKQSSRKPNITMSKEGTVRIKHRELLGNVSSSVEFEIAQSFTLNPGLKDTFPWLSQSFGGSFEQFQVHAMEVEFVTRTGTNTPGSVMIIPDYDAADNAPISEQVASSYKGMVEDAVWKDVRCRLDPAAMAGGRSKHFTRTGPLAANLDVKSYDVGTIFIATNDAKADSAGDRTGKLWLNYDISFFVPQLPPTGSTSIVGGSIGNGGTSSPQLPFGDDPSIDPSNNSVSLIGTPTPNDQEITITQPGDYVMCLWSTGTAITGPPGFVFINGASLGQHYTIAPDTEGGGTDITVIQNVRIGTGGGRILVTYDTLATTITSCYVYLGQAPVNSISI